MKFKMSAAISQDIPFESKSWLEWNIWQKLVWIKYLTTLPILKLFLDVFGKFRRWLSPNLQGLLRVIAYPSTNPSVASAIKDYTNIKMSVEKSLAGKKQKVIGELFNTFEKLELSNILFIRYVIQKYVLRGHISRK